MPVIDRMAAVSDLGCPLMGEGELPETLPAPYYPVGVTAAYILATPGGPRLTSLSLLAPGTGFIG